MYNCLNGGKNKPDGSCDCSTAIETLTDCSHSGGLGNRIYSNYNGGGATYCLDKENKYCSMHGIQELNQGVRELCVQKYQPDKLWDFVMKINKACSASNADTCWEAVAKTAGV